MELEKTTSKLENFPNGGEHINSIITISKTLPEQETDSESPGNIVV